MVVNTCLHLSLSILMALVFQLLVHYPVGRLAIQLVQSFDRIEASRTILCWKVSELLLLDSLAIRSDSVGFLLGRGSG